MTFLSPHPLDRLVYPFRTEITHSVQQFFVEMQPAYRFLKDPSFWTVWIAYLLSAFVLLSILYKPRRYRIWQFALLGGSCVLANQAARSLQDWCCMLFVIGFPRVLLMVEEAKLGTLSFELPSILKKTLKSLHSMDRIAKRLCASRAFRPQWMWVTSLVYVLIAISVFPPVARGMPRYDQKEWPAKAAEWIRSQGMTGRVFSGPNFGSYLGWRVGPGIRTYTDTRGFYFPAVFLEDSLLLPQMVAGWEDRLRRVLLSETDYLFLDVQGPNGALWRHLKEKGAKPSYLDEQAVLLTKQEVMLRMPEMAVPSK